MSKIPFFIKFTVSERAQVAEHAQIFIAESSEAIIEKNARDTCFYVLLNGEGHVCIEKNSQPVAEVGPGDIFGEIGFVLNTPRTTWVYASKTSVLMRVDQMLLNGLDPSARDKIKDQIIYKMAKTIEIQNELSQ
jgi:CRP-like cAMP-binding protein